MPVGTSRVALWLMPTPRHREQIRAVIEGLAATYSSYGHQVPVFEPHATLCTGTLPDGDLAELSSQVDAFCARQRQVVLAASKGSIPRQRKGRWSQFLFIPFGMDGVPPEMRDIAALRSAFPVLRDPSLATDAETGEVMPHVSLLYHDGPSDFPGIASEVGRNYVLPDPVVFDEVQVVMPRSGDWRDILSGQGPASSWDAVHTRSLAQATETAANTSPGPRAR